MYTKNALPPKITGKASIETICLQTHDTAYYGDKAFCKIENVTNIKF